MRDREANTQDSGAGCGTTQNRALQHVREAYRKEREAQAVTELGLHADDLADEVWRLHLAEDNLFNFLNHWGHEQAASDLRQVERRALYERAAPLNEGEMEALSYCCMITEAVEDLQKAHEALAKGAGRKRQTSVADAVAAAEGEMMDLFDRWELEELVKAMRTVQRRATLWCEMPTQEHQMPTYLFLDELILRMERLCEAEMEFGHLRKSQRRPRKPEHSALRDN